MSSMKTYLVIVYNTSDDRPWILDSLDNHLEVWQQLGEHRVDGEPTRQEEHQIFELRSPLNTEQVVALAQLKQQGLIFNFYVQDEIGVDL